MNHVGFWNEFTKYQKLHNEALDLFIKSLDYPSKSPERKICRLSATIERRKTLPILDNLISYVEKTDDARYAEMVGNLKRLRELNQEDLNV